MGGILNKKSSQYWIKYYLDKNYFALSFSIEPKPKVTLRKPNKQPSGPRLTRNMTEEQVFAELKKICIDGMYVYIFYFIYCFKISVT